jgi:hypothetical protein
MMGSSRHPPLLLPRPPAERTLIELKASDRNLEVSREGSK